MSDGNKKLTVTVLDEFLESESYAEDISLYLDAAAVLSGFDFFELHPVGGIAFEIPSEKLIDRLLPFCEPISEGAEHGLWNMVLPQRRNSLRRMGSRQKMNEALAANSRRPDTPLQRMWEQILGTSPIILDSLSREELAALVTATDWVEGILDLLPDKAAILDAIRRLDLLAPMRRLAGEGFVGRQIELAQLGSYLLSPKSRAPLYVFGSGGIGKSTLMARFVLASAVPTGAPIGYVDLDRPTVRADIPLTLLLDAVNQLSWQVNAPRVIVESLIKEITFAIARTEGGRQTESLQSWNEISNFSSYMETWLAGRVAVLIVDTLEEAQFLGSDVMYPLIDFLFRLDGAMPSLRLILSGRALPSEYVSQAFPEVPQNSLISPDDLAWSAIPLPVRPVNLAALEPDDAQKLLAESLRQGGSPALTVEEMNEVIGIVSRNPMCLKLAARLLRDEGIDKLRSAHSEVLARLKAEKVQALLYGRILGHIHTEDVKKIAYPGLIVRRIDADVIREVLAGPCGLELKPERNEYAILNDLANEAALVERDPQDYSLRHRVDVRRAMLEDLLDNVDKKVVDQIDAAAIAFYGSRTGAIARAEEIYHRLRQGQDEATLNQHWSDDAASGLQSAIEEIPPAQRLWLAEQLGVTLDESSRLAADMEAWERQAARSADRYLKAGSPQRALAAVKEREGRSARSPLYSLEAEAYRLSGQFDKALEVARKGADSSLGAGAIDTGLDLLLRMVVIEEVRGNLEAAEKLLRESAAVASHSSNRILQLRVDVTGLRLQRQIRPEAREERAALRRQVLPKLTDEMMQQLRSYPVLLREVAAELAKQDARLASVAIETLGAEVATDEQAVALGNAIVSLSKEGDSNLVLDPTLAEGAGYLETVRFDPEGIRKWVTQVMTSKDTRSLGGSVAAARSGTKILSDFRQYFRTGVASTLRGSGFNVD
jgi:hypothetical protein